MRNLNQLKVSTRLGIAFGLVLALILGLGTFTLWRLNQINQSSQDITANWLPASIVVSAMNTGTSDFRISELQHLLSTSDDDMAKYEKEMAANLEQMKLNRATYEKVISSPDELAQWKNFLRLWDLYLVENAKVLKLSRENKNEEARDLMRGNSEKLFVDGSDQLQKLVDLNSKGGSDATVTANVLYDSTVWIFLLVVGVVTVVCVAAGVLITRSITRQLGGEPDYAVQVASQIAAGDLSQSVVLRTGDSHSIAAALESMRTRLAEVVGQVRTSSDSIATGSHQIATGTADLSQRTEEQASSLQQTAASMEQLTSTVQSNASTAQEANRLAQQASTAASDGGKKVSSVVATMEGIAKSSKRVVDIIGVIDGIAFQTNILALNAAVEAARAGEQGRGFAVVASEVRSLAHRSAEAAKEIKHLIGDSVQKVEEGTQLVNETGTAMNDIVSQVAHVSRLINEITLATVEQTSGISQVGTAVTQMDQVTQQNAALVEESAAAADSLRVQASRLTEVVGVFKLAHQSASLIRHNNQLALG